MDIVFEPPVADPDASPADKQASAELLAKGPLHGVIFSTDRDCAFPDPSGNTLRASASLAGSELVASLTSTDDITFSGRYG